MIRYELESAMQASRVMSLNASACAEALERLEKMGENVVKIPGEFLLF